MNDVFYVRHIAVDEATGVEMGIGFMYSRSKWNTLCKEEGLPVFAQKHNTLYTSHTSYAQINAALEKCKGSFDDLY